MRYVSIILFLLVAHFVGCRQKAPDGPPITFIEEDDPQMKAAIEKAVNSLPDFNRALKAPKPSQSGFAIKTPFSDGMNVEHMWLSPVDFDGAKYHGVVNNKPKDVKGVELGTKISVEPAKVSDWMYVQNKKLVGGFTIRVVRDKLNAKARAEFDRGAPFTLD